VSRTAIAAALCFLVGAAAGAEVRLERQADGSLLMVNDAQAVPRWAPVDTRARSEIDNLIEAQARAQSLDPALVRAVVTVESSYDPAARSRKGAIGLMQLMPATARSLDVDDPYDAEQNLRGGTTYLRRMLDRFGGDLELALAAYNAGPEAVDRYKGLPPYLETHGYVDRVLRLLRGEEARPSAGVYRPGRRTFLHRDTAGRLVMTTDRPQGS
jgi:soluble lytic murein transglycosylase